MLRKSNDHKLGLYIAALFSCLRTIEREVNTYEAALVGASRQSVSGFHT